jgi:hypothetical protein
MEFNVIAKIVIYIGLINYIISQNVAFSNLIIMKTKFFFLGLEGEPNWEWLALPPTSFERDPHWHSPTEGSLLVYSYHVRLSGYGHHRLIIVQGVP